MRKKSKNKKKIKGLIITLVILLALVFVGFFFMVKSYTSGNGNDDTSIRICIPDNSTGKENIEMLAEEGIIKDANIVYYYAKLTNITMDFKAGYYDVNKTMSVKELFEYISDGQNAVSNTVTITFLEGDRIKEFAQDIANATTLEYDDIIAYWQDEDVIRSYMSDYPFLTEDIFNEDVKYYLEGYLSPDTYEFYYEATLDEITRKMLDQTLVIYNEYKDEFDESEYSISQIFTLASIIQRESGSKEDMVDISSVFYNRLNDGMQLQSSVTVCYALDIPIGGDWRSCEITQTRQDPYNTYQILGLPPGPIDNPSKNAIEAALNPSDTDYYFFVGDVCGSGETIFSKTYAEQLAVQEEYLTCY